MDTQYNMCVWVNPTNPFNIKITLNNNKNLTSLYMRSDFKSHNYTMDITTMQLNLSHLKKPFKKLTSEKYEYVLFKMNILYGHLHNL